MKQESIKGHITKIREKLENNNKVILRELEKVERKLQEEKR